MTLVKGDKVAKLNADGAVALEGSSMFEVLEVSYLPDQTLSVSLKELA